MEFFLRGRNEDFSSGDGSPSDVDIQRCPFLRNINEPTNFSFSSPLNFFLPLQGAKGPIFEDGPNFEMAFRLFHGHDGVVPLSGRPFSHPETSTVEPAPQFNPLAAKAATISLSAFGPDGPFSFHSFSNKWKKQKKKSSRGGSSSQGSNSVHEAMSNEWLDTGMCPIAKSYRAVSKVLPLVAKTLQPPPGMKLRCPPAVVAARAALARSALVRTLRPQPLPSKILAVATLGMAANVPLGIWREHTQKFSPSWFIAVHAAVPFIAMLRKCLLMPKTAMAFTIAASIMGQVIGSRAERYRLQALQQAGGATKQDETLGGVTQAMIPLGETGVGISHYGHCSDQVIWNATALRAAAIVGPCTTARVCF
ncbi:hypothetical protein H6P81_009321 [Aristolochia fimbriata]|uniref:Uncharacterized protein n=1 Tax=Aristolochia fimbriata TaxID=158543 RepID=A0AAV7ENR0_ARIFI|nr:hypothetical protein H6P81_009321 [Aristolochia fimbriata]